MPGHPLRTWIGKRVVTATPAMLSRFIRKRSRTLKLARLQTPSDLSPLTNSALIQQDTDKV